MLRLPGTSRAAWTTTLLALLLAGACSASGHSRLDGGRPPPGDAGRDTGTAGCNRTADADGDGIADGAEGPGDPDGDGVPNYLDDDSDGDGFLDSEERRSTDSCVPADTDTDGMPDFRDPDSDNDGLTDAEERAVYFTDPLLVDSDGDGVSDLGEVQGTGTDPNDPVSTIPPGDFFVVLPYLGDHAPRPLRFSTDIKIADVFFLLDMTASMREERTNLINGLAATIIPGIAARVPDVQFGVGGLDDYPVLPYGSETDHDLPFYLLREIAPYDQDLGAWSIAAGPTVCPSSPGTRDIGTITGTPNGRADLLEAVEGLPCHWGSDVPEAYGPALYATATGLGLSWPGGSVPARTCPSIPDEPTPRRGYPCFRGGALPIVLLFGDAPFHNSPTDSNPYVPANIPSTPSYVETRAALNDLGARVIGIFSGGAGLVHIHFNMVATDTGTVRADGTSPLTFAIMPDGSGLTTAVVDAVAQLVGYTPQDVDTRTENVLGNPDSFDATLFIKSVVPLEGYGVPGGAGTGYASKDATTFYAVVPGTQVEFTVDFYNDVRPSDLMTRIYKARIIVVGNGVATLDTRQVYIIVPANGQTILI